MLKKPSTTRTRLAYAPLQIKVDVEVTTMAALRDQTHQHNAAALLLVLLILAITPTLVISQTDYFDGLAIDDSEDNIVYLLLVVFFGINFITPVAYWFIRNYIQKWMDKAQDKILEIQQRITERISDAGRKFSDKMRT